MKRTVLKLLFLIALVTLTQNLFIEPAQAASPVVCGYLKNQNGTGMPGWWVKWTDSGDPYHPASVRYEGTDASGKFCFSDFSSLSDQDRDYISDTYINPTNLQVGQKFPTQNSSGFWDGSPDSQHPTRKASTLNGQAIQHAGFSCAQVPHTFTAILPQGVTGTVSTVSLSGGSADIEGHIYTNSQPTYTLPEIKYTSPDTPPGGATIACTTPPSGLSPNGDLATGLEPAYNEKCYTYPSGTRRCTMALQWSPVACAQSYDIRVDDSDNGTKDSRNNCSPYAVCIDGYKPPTTYSNGTPASNPFIEIDVVPGRKYKWWVHGRTGTTPTASSEVANFSTQPPTTDSPTTSLNTGTPGEVLLGWTANYGRVNNYWVNLNDETVSPQAVLTPVQSSGSFSCPANTASTQCFKTTTTTQAVRGLVAGHKYKWLVSTWSNDSQRFGLPTSAVFTAPGTTGVILSAEDPVKCGSYSKVTWSSTAGISSLRVAYKAFNGNDPTKTATPDSNGFVTLAITTSGSYDLWVPGPAPLTVTATPNTGTAETKTITCTTGSTAPTTNPGTIEANGTFHKQQPANSTTNSLYRDNVVFQWEPYTPPSGQNTGIYHLVVCSSGSGLNCNRAIDQWTSSTSFTASYLGPLDYNNSASYPNTVRPCQNGSSGLCFNGSYSWQVYWAPAQGFSAVALYTDKGWNQLAKADTLVNQITDGVRKIFGFMTE